MLEIQKGVTPANPFRSHTHTHASPVHHARFRVGCDLGRCEHQHEPLTARCVPTSTNEIQFPSTKHKAQSTEQARVCVSVGFATATAHHQARSALTTAMTGAHTAESAGPSLEIAHTCSVANAGAGSSSAGGSLDQTRFGHCKPKLAAGVDDSTTSPKLLLTTLLLYCHARP